MVLMVLFARQQRRRHRHKEHLQSQSGRERVVRLDRVVLKHIHYHM